MRGEIAVFHYEEVKAFRVLIGRISDVERVEVALEVVDREDVLAAPPVSIATKNIDGSMLQKRKGRHGDVVALAVPRLKNREAPLLVVADRVVLFAVEERADRLVPKHGPN